MLDAKAPVHFPEKVRGEVTFDDVSFRYNKAEDMALEHITFTAVEKPGMIKPDQRSERSRLSHSPGLMFSGGSAKVSRRNR